MAQGKIRIFYDPPRPDGLRQYQQGAYAWRCPCCDRHGRNAFNRFSDLRNPNPVHPFVRCWEAVELHLWRHHRHKE